MGIFQKITSCPGTEGLVQDVPSSIVRAASRIEMAPSPPAADSIETGEVAPGDRFMVLRSNEIGKEIPVLRVSLSLAPGPEVVGVEHNAEKVRGYKP